MGLLMAIGISFPTFVLAFSVTATGDFQGLILILIMTSPNPNHNHNISYFETDKGVIVVNRLLDASVFSFCIGLGLPWLVQTGSMTHYNITLCLHKDTHSGATTSLTGMLTPGSPVGIRDLTFTTGSILVPFLSAGLLLLSLVAFGYVLRHWVSGFLGLIFPTYLAGHFIYATLDGSC